MQLRMQELTNSMTLSTVRCAHPARSASIPASIAFCLSVGRGRFWGWNSRPAHRPVRMAPQNCSSPRRRPSRLVPRCSTRYLLVLVLLACSRISSNSRMAGFRSVSDSAFSMVAICRSGRSMPNASNRCSRKTSFRVVLDTLPSVISRVRPDSSCLALSIASMADRTRARSICTPRSLMRWSSCHSSRSAGVKLTVGMRFLTSRMASTSLAA